MKQPHNNYSCLLPLEQIAAPECDSSLGAAGVTERSCGRSRGVAVGDSHINEDSMRNSKTWHWQQPCRLSWQEKPLKSQRAARAETRTSGIKRGYRVEAEGWKTVKSQREAALGCLKNSREPRVSDTLHPGAATLVLWNSDTVDHYLRAMTLVTVRLRVPPTQTEH